MSSKSQLTGSIVTQWKALYPFTPFPSPSSSPQMYPPNFPIKQTIYYQDYSWWNQLTGDCCAYSRCCPVGYIDYECQYKNSCYLNLASYCIHILIYILMIIGMIIILGILGKWIYKLVISAIFIKQFLKFVAGWMSCLTFGIFDQNVYYKIARPKANLTQNQKAIVRRMKEIRMKVIVSRLDQNQKLDILNVFQDYQIVGQDTFCYPNQNKFSNQDKQSQIQ